MESRGEDRLRYAAATSRRQWKSTHALACVHELNERCLAALSECAAAPRDEIALPVAIECDRDEWRKLDGASRLQAAKNPVLLVDFHFSDADWWRSTVEESHLHSLRPTGVGFPPSLARDLAFEALMLAWLAARESCQAASLLIGMSGDVSRQIALLTPTDLNRIASRFGNDIRVRWQNSTLFWRKLLAGAKGADLAALRHVHLYCLRLLGSDLQKNFPGLPIA